MKPSTILMLAGGGLVLYYLFNRPTAAVTAAPGQTQIGTGLTPAQLSILRVPPLQVAANAANQTTTATATATPTGSGVIAKLYTALASKAAADGVDINTGVGPDAWNWYLGSVLTDNKLTFSPPDPLAVWPGVDRAKPMTLSAYWNGMSAYITKTQGLSGMGALQVFRRTNSNRQEQVWRGYQPPYQSPYFRNGGWAA